MATCLTPEEAAKHLRIGKPTLCEMVRDVAVAAQTAAE